MSQLNDTATAATAAVAIDPAALQALVQSRTATVSNVLVASTTNMKYSTLIDTYDTTYMEAEKKDGKYEWAIVTKMIYGWKLVTVKVENA